MTTAAPSLAAREAVGRLFDQHGDLVYRLGLRACGDGETAEDLVQETFLRALSAWDRFESRSKASTWLYTIASRACQRMKRRRAGQPEHIASLERLLPSGDEGLIQIPSNDDPEQRVVRGEVTEVVRAAIAELPAAFRFPLVLREIFDFSIQEIAEVLEIKEATVKTRLHRARLRLRQHIARSLPSRPGSPTDHARDDCLALLKAKQESLDRGTPFPVPEDELCQRCRSVFATLDLGREVCLSLGEGTMPDALRTEVERALAT